LQIGNVLPSPEFFAALIFEDDLRVVDGTPRRAYNYMTLGCATIFTSTDIIKETNRIVMVKCAQMPLDDPHKALSLVAEISLIAETPPLGGPGPNHPSRKHPGNLVWDFIDRLDGNTYPLHFVVVPDDDPALHKTPEGFYTEIPQYYGVMYLSASEVIAHCQRRP